MNRLTSSATMSIDELTDRLADKWQIGSRQLLPFSDFTEAITALFIRIGESTEQIMTGGLVSPEIQIAANRADLTCRELTGKSPFVAHPEEIIDQINSPREIIYLANPNRITGSNLSARQVDMIARAIPDGWLVIDEKYFDYFGITTIPFLSEHRNLIIFRSLSTGFGIESDDSGVMVACQDLVADLSAQQEFRPLSVKKIKSFTMSLDNEQALASRLTEIHDESFRLATSLTEKGVQNRLTATDYLLLRVADPTRVGNFLARYGTPIENLEGYPLMKHYVKYRVQSPVSNDRFLEAFGRMPVEFFRMKDIDRRAIVFHKQEAEKETQPETENRLKVAIHRSTKSKETSLV